MITVDAFEARANLYNLIESAFDGLVRITSESGTVVMVSEDAWDGLMETLYLLGIPGLLEDIKEGRETLRSYAIRVRSDGL